ncbi:thiosulfate sulfurtransferase [Alkalilimnicola ehrlichii]|uniref:Sulfurtransferase n=1 Tax=Alkalilimnicola ehrlichii TaxID=351052 RepID=A0A3E0WS59_9GAMM|nr:sulfurtransferase [Alkalilimnicola ehrlichii]RFA28217.1 thiosulfate sulfurtransferase [Alkalilimnicola ehrlichii]RFA34816.1 thiosulfate sulfurtransferase [Alkalilimnicola ehrlichii]
MTTPELPLVIEPDQLHRHLLNEQLLIVDLSDPNAYADRHVPGAVNLPYSRIVHAEPPAMGLLPDEAQLSRVFSEIGLKPELHVVAYDQEGNGRASRLLWTLDALGHERISLLNGGLHAWVNDGHHAEAGIIEPYTTDYRARIEKPEVLADKSYVLTHLNDPHVKILDARSPAEFAGEDKRAARVGHIPGAVNLEWVQTMDQGRHLRFKPDPELREMLKVRGITPEKEIVVHCQTHHRSAHTYVLLKHLGFERVRGYAGSWSEWGNDPNTPVEV